MLFINSACKLQAAYGLFAKLLALQLGRGKRLYVYMDIELTSKRVKRIVETNIYEYIYVYINIVYIICMHIYTYVIYNQSLAF